LHSGIDICAMGQRHTPIIHEHVGCVRWGQRINNKLASIAAATASAMRHKLPEEDRDNKPIIFDILRLIETAKKSVAEL
jgi:hypothetical protein